MFHRLAHNGFMPGSTKPVQHNTFDHYPGINFLAAQDQGGNGTCRLGAVHHEQNRKLKVNRKFRCTVCPFYIHTIEQAPVAFDNCHFSLSAMLHKDCLITSGSIR